MVPSSKTINSWRLIIGITLIGLIARIALSFTSIQFYYADALFQIREPAFRLAFGYGIQSIEYQLHLRSYLVPWLLSWYLQLLDVISIHNTWLIHQLVNVIFAIISLSIPLSLWFLGKRLYNQLTGVLAAVIASFWYELVYFGTQSFFEVFATYLYLPALALMLSLRRHTLFFSGFLWGIAAYLRPQYLPAIILGLWLISTKRKIAVVWPRVLGGILLAFFLAVSIDWYIVQEVSLVNYIISNIQRDQSLLAFASPQHISDWFYFSSPLIASGGLLLVLFLKNFKYTSISWLHIAAVVISHSFITHQEYRFIFLYIPFWILGMSYVISTQTPRVRSGLLVMVSVISLAGLLGKLPSITSVYNHDLLTNDSHLLAYHQLSTIPDICGIVDLKSPWMLSGGYYFLKHDVPAYDQLYSPTNQEYVNTILIDANMQIDQPEYQRIHVVGNTAIYMRDGECSRDINYHTQRDIF